MGSHTEFVREKVISIFEEKNYKCLGHLGTGGFGDVLKMSAPNEDVIAMKIITSSNITTGETEIWRNLKHPNILEQLEIFSISDPPAYAITMPLMECALDELVEDVSFRSSTDSLTQVKNVIKDILHGINYLHNLNLAHMDLKVNNVLISQDKKGILCDFSFLTSSSNPVKG